MPIDTPALNPAEFRRRRESRRNVGLTLVLIGVIAALACIVGLFLEVRVSFSGAPAYFCGGLIDPFPNTGEGAAGCAAVLADHAVFAAVTGGIAVAALAAGIATLVRNPR